MTARDTMRAVLRLRGEILTGLALLAGWLLLTAGIAQLTAPVVWYFSLGLLGCSLGGWKLLGVLIWHGLYALTRDEEKP